MKRTKTLTISQIIFALSILLFPAASFASGELSKEYESSYHHLLEQEQRLLDDRANAIRNLNQCDSWLNQIDKALLNFSPSLNRQKLISSRSLLLNMKDKFQKDLDYCNSSLHNIDKDIAWVEAEMKHLAAMR